MRGGTAHHEIDNLSGRPAALDDHPLHGAQPLTAHSTIRRTPGTAPVTFWDHILETCRSLAGCPEPEAEISQQISAWSMPSERIAFALGALMALRPEDAEMLITAYAEATRAGPPDIDFYGTMADAREWSAIASEAQLRAITWAAYHRLHRASQVRFIRRVLEDSAPELRHQALVAAWDLLTAEERRLFVAQVAAGRPRMTRNPFAGATNVDFGAASAAGGALAFIDAASLADRSVPPRQWHVEGLIPARTVTLLDGDGGTGKSLLALQLAVSTAAGRLWLDREVKPGPVLFVSAEDDLDELHRRLDDIAAAEAIGMDELGDLSICSLAGEIALLATVDPTTRTLAPTQRYFELDRKMPQPGRREVARKI